MTEEELLAYIDNGCSRENEQCEWKDFKNLKHAVSGEAGDDIISYVSALSNMEGGALVVGVNNKHVIVGIQEFHDYTADNIRLRILGRCPNLDSEGFRIEPHTTTDTKKTVWIVRVPRHRPRLPVYAHDKAWQRIDDSLIQMRPERLAAILAEPLDISDWSSHIVEDAGLEDLDVTALKLAREKFLEKHRNAAFADAIRDWDARTFLDKAKITVQGRITRTALLLLGKQESSHFLLPAVAQITWKLAGEETAYEHFGLPFLLTTTQVLRRIRNIPYKIFPQNQLLATEVGKYDTRVILEALHNCIAHQDYALYSRVLVTEQVDRLTFENAGTFYDGRPEDYFAGELTPKRYRNPMLAQAMVNLNMIDTVGRGIHTMLLSQRNRYFPLPDYSKSRQDNVVLDIFGHMIEENYTRLLMEQKDLPLNTVILLDRVQKRLPITNDAVAMLKRAGLIEGRKPNYFVSASVAAATDNTAGYMRNMGLKKDSLKEFVLGHIRQFGPTPRKKLEELLFSMLPAVLDPVKKQNKVKNLLTEMRSKDGTIRSLGKGPTALWVINNR